MKIKLSMKAIMLTALLVGMALSLAAPVMANGNGPKYTKYVSPLKDGDSVRLGQVIYNTNPEDNGKYELEVEIEECMALASSWVTVKLDGTVLTPQIWVDADGNGKETFEVDAFAPGSDVIDVGDGELTTDTGDYHTWAKIKGQK